MDRATGALVLPSVTIEPDVTRFVLLASPLGAQATCLDMRTGWMHIDAGPQAVDGLTFGVRLVFEGERLDGYSSGWRTRASAPPGTTGPKRSSSRDVTRTTPGSPRHSGQESVGRA